MDFLIGGTAAMCACLFTNPLEVVKIRMQLQGELRARGQYAVFYKNFAHGLWTIARTDGVLALQNGLVPALWFQLALNGFRLGIYQVADDSGFVRSATGETKFLQSVFFSALGGTVGAVVASPTYMVKTQMQAYGDASIAVGHQHKHEGMIASFFSIYRKDGIKGLYRGVWSSVPRASIGSAAQMTSFTSAKDYLIQNNAFPDSPLLRTFVAANIGGMVMSLFMTPFDVVSTRMYNQGTSKKGEGLLYKGVTDCFIKIAKTEGLLGFYKGLGPSYLRIGPHTVLVLVFWDELKILREKFNKR